MLLIGGSYGRAAGLLGIEIKKAICDSDAMMDGEGDTTTLPIHELPHRLPRGLGLQFGA